MVIEPSADQSKHRAAGVFARKEVRQDPELLKQRLKEIREFCRTNNKALADQLRKKLAEYQSLNVVEAKNGREAAALIAAIAGSTKLASVNKSNVVINEVRPFLHDKGIQSYIRYFTEFNNFEKEKFTKKVADYWSLPGMHGRGLVESFDARKTVSRFDSDQTRDYVAILGINAISAEDGSIFVLQHMSNISRDLEQARKVILVVTPEKILRNSSDALHHARSMGIFGLESILLDLAPRAVEEFDFQNLPVMNENNGREIHVIFLDNGRQELLNGAYRDLFLCIDCRACARQCPIGQHVMIDKGMVYSPKNYLFGFLKGLLPAVDACLHCGRCHVECPVDIDIPAYMWKSQCEHYEKQGRSWKKRMLDDPELLAKVGSLAAPLSNWAVKLPPVKMITELFAGIHRKSHLPMFHRQTFRDWLKGGRRNG
jgi:L-lactate utilization protein LutB